MRPVHARESVMLRCSSCSVTEHCANDESPGPGIISAGQGLNVARGGVEPPTFRFSGGRSYQLSYLAVTPGIKPGAAATQTGLEPATSAVTGRHSNQLNYRIMFLFLKELRFFFVMAKVQLFSLPANLFQKKCLPKTEGVHYQIYFFYK